MKKRELRIVLNNMKKQIENNKGLILSEISEILIDKDWDEEFDDITNFIGYDDVIDILKEIVSDNLFNAPKFKEEFLNNNIVMEMLRRSILSIIPSDFHVVDDGTIIMNLTDKQSREFKKQMDENGHIPGAEEIIMSQCIRNTCLENLGEFVDEFLAEEKNKSKVLKLKKRTRINNFI